MNLDGVRPTKPTDTAFDKLMPETADGFDRGAEDRRQVSPAHRDPDNVSAVSISQDEPRQPLIDAGAAQQDHSLARLVEFGERIFEKPAFDAAVLPDDGFQGFSFCNPDNALRRSLDRNARDGTEQPAESVSGQTKPHYVEAPVHQGFLHPQNTGNNTTHDSGIVLLTNQNFITFTLFEMRDFLKFVIFGFAQTREIQTTRPSWIYKVLFGQGRIVDNHTPPHNNSTSRRSTPALPMLDSLWRYGGKPVKTEKKSAFQM